MQIEEMLYTGWASLLLLPFRYAAAVLDNSDNRMQWGAFILRNTNLSFLRFRKCLV
jgi:hypothetical protein